MFNDMKKHLCQIPHFKVQNYLYKEDYLEVCPFKQQKGSIPKYYQSLALTEGIISMF